MVSLDVVDSPVRGEVVVESVDGGAVVVDADDECTRPADERDKQQREDGGISPDQGYRRLEIKSQGPDALERRPEPSACQAKRASNRSALAMIWAGSSMSFSWSSLALAERPSIEAIPHCSMRGIRTRS